MHNFRKLEVWRRSVDFVGHCYELTGSFPSVGRYGLASQIQRSAVSVPSNIAEGVGRGTKKELRRYLMIALGSACELETQLVIAGKAGYIEETELGAHLDESAQIQRMLFALSQSVAESA